MMPTRKSAHIKAATARAVFPAFNRQNIFLMDPEKPREDPNDLLNRVHHGRMLDPRAMNHNCPFCNKTMAYDLFLAHAEDCFKRWRKVVYRKQRTIGTVVQSTLIKGASAAAASDVERKLGG